MTPSSLLQLPLLQQSAPSGSATAADPNTFRPDTGERVTTSGETLLVAAYAIMWALAFAIVYISFRKQRSLDERITRLSDELARARKSAPAPSAQKGEPKREAEDLDA